MIDCTITENFLREKLRMCSLNSDECKGCGLSDDNNGKDLYCGDFCGVYPADAVAIVQKWSDEHPQRTMLDDFKEKYPNAPIEENGIPKICPSRLGYDSLRDCPKNTDGFGIGCVACWNRPYEECEQK